MLWTLLESLFGFSKLVISYAYIRRHKDNSYSREEKAFCIKSVMNDVLNN